jgi:hypothetical protein
MKTVVGYYTTGDQNDVLGKTGRLSGAGSGGYFLDQLFSWSREWVPFSLAGPVVTWIVAASGRTPPYSVDSLHVVPVFIVSVFRRTVYSNTKLQLAVASIC